jgi:phosphate transport system protein
MQQATQALLEADIVLAETVSSDHESLVIQAVQTEGDAFTLLALASTRNDSPRTSMSLVAPSSGPECPMRSMRPISAK